MDKFEVKEEQNSDHVTKYVHLQVRRMQAPAAILKFKMIDVVKIVIVRHRIVL